MEIMEKKLNDSQLDKVSAGMLEPGFVEAGSAQDTGFRDALMRRQIEVQDREWELKIWQAYQENGRQWVDKVMEVANQAIDAGAAVYTGGASKAGKSVGKAVR